MKRAQSIYTFCFIDAARISNFIHRNSATLGQRIHKTNDHAAPDELRYEPTGGVRKNTSERIGVQ